MANAIRFYETGGPEVLRYEEVSVGEPGPGQVRLRHAAVGLNYADTYFRNGTYPIPMPNGLGVEAAGVVEAVGEGVSEVAVGDRVAYATAPLGAYAEARNVPANVLVPLPDALSFEQGAAMLMQGLTAQYLLRRTYRVQAGDTILVHAARGDDPVPVGESARRNGDRHRGLGAQGRAGAGQWLRSSDCLHARKFCSARARADRRRRRAGDL